MWQDIARKGSNRDVCVRTADQVREKLSDMKKDFFFFREENKEKEKKQERNKQTNKKWGTGAVRDKPFDELLMFINVGKDSALFSGLSENGR